MSRVGPFSFFGVALSAVLLAGCEPSCSQTCNQALKCDVISQGVTKQECVDSCTRQEVELEVWVEEELDGAQELQLAFDEHRSCVVQATCDELVAGECYNEELFSF